MDDLMLGYLHLRGWGQGRGRLKTLYKGIEFLHGVNGYGSGVTGLAHAYNKASDQWTGKGELLARSGGSSL